MCKSVAEIEFEKYFLKQNAYKKDEYINSLKSKLSYEVKLVKKLILKIFMEHILNDVSLALYDENIYEIYKMIIDKYKGFLEKVDNVKIQINPDALKILSGIVAVLKSQVNFFDENCQDTNINPIYIEKKAIILNYLDKVYDNIDKFEDNEQLKILKESFDIKEEFIKYVVNKINFNYETNMIDCIHAINDIEKREKLSYYNDTLEEEREILASIIKVQVKALEDLCKTEEEKDIVQILLKPLREVYQHTNKMFDELSNNFKMIESTINLDFSDDVIHISSLIRNIFNTVDIEQQNFRGILKAKFDIVVEEDFQKNILNREHSLNILKSEIESAINLSNDIRKIFYNLCTYIAQSRDYYKELEEYKIIEGIYESINIKVENISEKQNEIFLEKDDILKNIEEEISKIRQNPTILYNFDEINSLLIKDFNIKNVLSFIGTDDTFLNIDNQIKRYLSVVEDFIKNTILFEISTFQEIISYSVVRLRNNNNSSVNTLTNYIDKSESIIEIKLKQNNIIIIKPNSHDIFDSKEHEVLLAEKNEEFLKGEIIKVVNYGYKTKNKVVIKRATVVAAK